MRCFSSQEEERFQFAAAASADGRVFDSHRPGGPGFARRQGSDRQQAGPGIGRDHRTQEAAFRIRRWTPRVIVPGSVRSWSWKRPQPPGSSSSGVQELRPPVRTCHSLQIRI